MTIVRKCCGAGRRPAPARVAPEGSAYDKCPTRLGRYFIEILTIALFVGVAANSAFGAAFTLSARVDRDRVFLQDTFTYEVIISGEDIANVPNPELPDMRGKFNVIGSSESTAFSWVNGNVSSSRVRRYSLMPVQTGKFILGPSKVTFQGQVMQTEAITIVVEASSVGGGVKNQPMNKAGSAAPAPVLANNENNALFLYAHANKKVAYVGEQIAYSLQFYRRVRIYSDVSYQLADFKGCWLESLAMRNEPVVQNINGMQYYVFDLAKRAVFPVDAGTLRIGEAKAAFIINPFQGQQVIQSEPVVIKVKPLPEEGKPARFSGCVGTFSLSASVASKSVDQNAPLSVKVVLSGQGNLRSVSDLCFSESPDYKIYKSKAVDRLDNNGIISGTREFEYVFIPKVSGTITLPVFSFNFFSPEAKQYKTIQTSLISIEVRPSLQSETTASFTGQKAASDIEILRQEIHYLKPVDLKRNYRYAFQNPVLLVVFGLDFLALMSAMGFFLKQRFFKSDAVAVRRQQAYDVAIKSLRELSFDEKDTALFSKLQTILLEFFSHKLGVSCMGLTRDELRQQLVLYQMPDAANDHGMNLLEKLAFMAYAPSRAGDSDRREWGRQIQAYLMTLKPWKPVRRKDERKKR